MYNGNLRIKDFTAKNKRLSEICQQRMEELLIKLKPTVPTPCLLLVDKLPERRTLESHLEQFRNARIPFSDVVLIYFDQEERDQRNTWDAIETGIKDIFMWTDENDYVNYIESITRRKQQVSTLLESTLVKNNLLGESRAWKQFLTQVIEVSLFSRSSFLLIGESGTGKELISRLIHTIDPREKKKELVLVDCTTIVPELSGSEFFGHERGSYTNAVQSREGAFALADKGTLFLDEIGELPLNLQAELLRVIQEGTFKKVGSNTWQKTQFRLICATHRNLRELIDLHNFRQDLFYRISDFEFRVPNLKERIDDIPVLAKHFLREFFDKKDPPEFDTSVLEFLVRREYPGNVRELRQLIHRIALRHANHKKITPGEIPMEDRIQTNHHPIQEDNIYLEISLKKAILSGASLWDLKNKTMNDAIRIAMQLTNGNTKQAAEKLGVTSRSVQQFLKNHKQ